jgi:hypothetical protein
MVAELATHVCARHAKDPRLQAGKLTLKVSKVSPHQVWLGGYFLRFRTWLHITIR